MLVPFVTAIVTSVSLADNVIEIDPPDGLLEIETDVGSRMRIDVITIFPEYLEPLRQSLPGKAIDTGIVELRVHDLRRWTHDVHRSVDDTPYGGGPGMVMKAPVWGEALDEICSPETLLVVPTPAGVSVQAAGRRSGGARKPTWCSRAAGMRGSTNGSSRTPLGGCASKRCRSAITCCRAGSRRRW